MHHKARRGTGWGNGRAMGAAAERREAERRQRARRL